jgi:signal transduction histidine kinase/CHASE3 domain sensor protein
MWWWKIGNPGGTPGRGVSGTRTNGNCLKPGSLPFPERLRFVAIIFLAAILLLAGTIVFVSEVSSVRAQAQKEMSEQLRILLQLDDFAASLKQTESTERAFLLTGEESYLESYTDLKKRVFVRLEDMRKLVTSGDLAKEEIHRLSQLTPQRFSEMDETIRVRRTQGLPAALEIARANESRNLMGQLHSQTTRLRHNEEQEYFEADQQASRAATRRNRATLAGCCLNLLVFLWAFWTISTEMRQQQNGVRALSRLHEVGAGCARAGDAFNKCLEQIVEAAIELAHADKGNLQLLDHVGHLSIAAQRGFGDSFIEFVARARGDAARSCERALHSGERIVIEDVAQDKSLPSDLAEALLAEKVRAMLCTPLISNSGKLLGLIATANASPSRPTESQLQLMDLLARQAADYLERKQVEMQLQNAHDQLGDRAVQLEALVQERTARLHEMVGDLEAFSYSIVHDMRAPLRAMQSFAQMLAEEYGPLSPTADMYVRRIKTAASRMDHLIQDGLNFSHYMRSELPLSAMDPGALLRGMLETYPAFHPTQARIEVVGEFPPVKANDAALTQCISNLLDNAIKFVAPNVMPQVRIWAETHDGRTRLYFADNGVGIKKESQEKIFKIFQRLDQRHEGTGIGLAIVKKAVERMGGSVGLESAPGRGSTFWLELESAVPVEQPTVTPTREHVTTS